MSVKVCCVGSFFLEAVGGGYSLPDCDGLYATLPVAIGYVAVSVPGLRPSDALFVETEGIAECDVRKR